MIMRVGPLTQEINLQWTSQFNPLIRVVSQAINQIAGLTLGHQQSNLL